MATFYLQQRDAEGLAGGGAWSKTLSTDLSTPGSITFTIPNSTTTPCLAITNRQSPGNADWADGTVTVKIRVTTANSSAFLATQLVRFNSSGVAQENTGNSTEQNISATGVYTFTHTSTTWTAGACDDRFAIWFYFRSSNLHGGDISVTVETGTTDEEVAFANLTRNAGTCYGVFVKDLKQFHADHTTAIAEGGATSGEGVTSDIYLDAYAGAYEWFESGELLTGKVEAEIVGTAFDNTSVKTETFYFNGTITDPNSVWTDDANAFDGSTATLANVVTAGSVSANYLQGVGTNAPAHGGVITQVRVRNYSSSGTSINSAVYDSTLLLGTANPPPSIEGYGGYITLAAPVGGWTWTKLQGLTVKNYSDSGFSKNLRIIELEVTSSSHQSSAIQTNPKTPNIRRSASACYDSLRKRYLLCGGIDDVDTQYNDLWELSLADIGSPKPQWKKLSPTGIPMSARRTHVMEFDATNDRVIIGYGYDGADKSDLFSIQFTTESYPDLFNTDSPNGKWVPLSPTGSAPAARAQLSSAFKQTGDKMYFACGWGAARYNDVYELDVTTRGSEVWTLLNSGGGTAPSTRNDPAVVYDDANNRLILFGGNNGTVKLNDVWELDLTTNVYTQLSSITGTAPSVRELALACYDPVFDRMIIFGGRDATTAAGVRTDIFQLDLTDGAEAWTDLTEAAGSRNLGVWSNGIAVYDPLHSAIVYATGMDESLYETRQAFAFDLSVDNVARPYGLFLNNGLNGRDAMAYAYNPDRRETLAMGGYRDPEVGDLFNGDHTSEIWLYDHANSYWYQPIRDSIFAMPPREGASACYDTARNRFLIFGGFTGNDTANNYHYNDTWEVKADANGVYRLTRLNPTGTKPSARWLQATVYDITNDRMIMFGGDAAGTYQNDTWELDFSGSADGVWAQLSPTGTAPSARRQPTYIYDATNGRMIISHGGTGVNSFVSNTFALDLSTNNGAWSSIGTGTPPDARRGMAGVYAADKEYMFCTGGFDGTNVKNDTFYFNLATNAWTTLSPGVQYLARRSHTAGYDQTSETLMIFGGRDAADDGLSFQTRNNNYFFVTTNATEANWTWSFTVLQPYLQISIPVTRLTAASDYHWQAWATGINQGDSQKVSAFSNAESVADFNTGTGVTSTAITKSLQYSIYIESDFSREVKATLPNVTTNLATAYTSQNYTDVLTDNNVYVDLSSTSTGYFLNMFKHAHTNSVDPVTVNVKVKTTLAPSTSTIYLQLWNKTLSQWDTYDTDNTTAVNTELTLTAAENVNQTDYYMTGNFVAARVYQQKT